MKISALCTLLVFTLFSSRAAAQQVVVNDTLSGTPLTMMMDAKVNSLLADIENKCSRENERSASNDDYRATPVRPSVPERELTQAEICRRNPRIMGYKIQVAVVKSNEEARQIGANFRRKFPSMKVEIDASLRPNYKVLAGSYLTKQSAAGDLSRVRQQFNGAISVQYRVFCAEAK